MSYLSLNIICIVKSLMLYVFMETGSNSICVIIAMFGLISGYNEPSKSIGTIFESIS